MSISKFYDSREVFVTGVTGSLGKVLLEKLLRSCNNEKIYVLIRSKKGMTAEERKMELFRSKIFENVLLKNPEITDKVECIEGDLTRENLEISSCHMNLITKNVSVVFHLAASVKFDEPFRDSFVNNVETTKNVVEVCRQMKNLVAFVHASTAYSFCDRKEVDEKIYTMARSYEEFKNIANVENYSSVEITKENLLENRPNTYTLTKAITENYLNNFCRDLPVVIVRPSIVISTWKEPFSGWNDGNSGTDYAAAIGLKGILRSMLCDEAKICDFVPSDTVVNLMLAAAWRKSIMPHRREEIAVYNCTSGSINPFTLQQFFKCLNIHYWKHPSENTFLYPTNIPKKNYYWNRVCIMTQHELPAMLADVLLVAIGRKPKMMKVYDKVHNKISTMEYFSTRDWKFSTRNVQELLERMSTKDEQCFDFDISKLNWDRYMEDYFLGIRRFVLKEDDSTIARSRKLILMKYYIILLAKCVLLFGFLYILSFYSF
ncbi:putative fatty acyl-CoA reductase CG5065 [Centruroides sculpturatus]|uniref:putative fatty acyl-CoA reductase CG5065 n=1 Tax=Centruroides sculpturatus TaxID=218467 RepID=UPI000C6D7947|nr:putative fatty acyl-CoA reductase CG5065 [Centruroides sculpturatus]